MARSGVTRHGRHGTSGGVLERTLAILELLAANARGLPLSSVADQLGIPRSAAHRLLTSLVAARYVAQPEAQADYRLTAKIASLALTFLSDIGVTDLAQPVLDRLARETGELVRLALVDGETLTFVAKAQGSAFGLRYDPDMGREPRLSCTSNGQLLLAQFDDERAAALASRQGFGHDGEVGPRAPRTPEELLRHIRLVRKRGYALTLQTFAPGMHSIAWPVRRPDGGEMLGIVSVAGPAVRLPEARLIAFLPLLRAAAEELSLVDVAAGRHGDNPLQAQEQALSLAKQKAPAP
ncbi:IclR family transcriptional regulator [Bosea sp. (in: a-proteobacteria)]|jgi:IclR family acetate operon transcriptional repressor|uniref:IclR family transcriptional regulator n=1 Tax=Bosea sp. (in: a-proteobacteria) TaxID=1871050 RepID=UPI003F71DEA0